ncbi:alpha/beta fold hydrolase [Nitratireductor arenosus]|nr:alpha/beta hydrolase [Nitratireductor arenosus]
MRKETLDAVFSLLPKRNAEFAIRRLYERMKQQVKPDAFQVRWAEFEFSGRFLRGGISDISDLATVIISNNQSDFGISLLAARASSGDLSAGLMEWNREYESFLWFLPYRFSDAQGKAGMRLRGLLITSDLFGEIMELFNSSANLTRSEKRTVFQLVGGLELREAAEMDEVTYETKRAQTKVACGKLRCTGQKDLVRKAMGQLVHVMSVSDSELKHSEPAVAFADSYLHDDMQLVVRHHSSGAILRYLVGGPIEGTPVVMVHGMMFPVILRGIARFLERYNIRLFVPIRSGYLESRPLGALFERGDLVELGLREIAYMVEEEGLAPLPLIGNSLGGALALRMALEYPHLFSSVILLSTNLARPADNPWHEGSSFYKGMHDLKSDMLLFKLVNLEYRKFYSKSETCRHILSTHFAKSKVDLSVLDGRYTGYAVYDMFASTYVSSIVGIAEDFRCVMTAEQISAEELTVPLSIIHGEDDPLTSAEKVIDMFKAPLRGVQRIVKGAGHFASISHGKEVWGAVAEACDGQGWIVRRGGAQAVSHSQ